MAESILPEEYVDNLRSVNLHLHGVVHGNHYKSSRGESYIDRAPESEYRGVKSMINGLSSDRGDVVTIEAPGYTDENEQWLAETREKARKGTFYPDQHPDMLAYRRHSNPIEYAADLALTKKIPVYYADINQAEKANIESNRGFIESAFYSLFGYNMGRPAHERDLAILGDLAQVAGNMATSASCEKPTLAHTVGANHVWTLGRILRVSGVPYTHNLRPIDAVTAYLKASQVIGIKEVRRRRYANPPKQSPYGGSY